MSETGEFQSKNIETIKIKWFWQYRLRRRKIDIFHRIWNIEVNCFGLNRIEIHRSLVQVLNIARREVSRTYDYYNKPILFCLPSLTAAHSGKNSRMSNAFWSSSYICPKIWLRWQRIRNDLRKCEMTFFSSILLLQAKFVKEVWILLVSCSSISSDMWTQK